MLKKILVVALLAAAGHSHAGLTQQENDYIVDLIKNRYAPMGLTAREIIVLVRDLGNRFMQYEENADGTTTFLYEERSVSGAIRVLGPVYTIRLQPQTAAVQVK